jgi:cyclohexyl-isocyanide hydratase
MSQRGLLHIGGLLFNDMDQADFTGPFEVLSRLPDSRFHIIGKGAHAVRDAKGLVLTPETTFELAPSLDVLLVPGGAGVNAVMQDPTFIEFIKVQARNAKYVMSVCTGALVCGAAGLLHGRNATTHWASHHLLAYFGATAVNARVVVDGNLVTTAGVTAGYDGALRLASLLCGERVARKLQLYLEYAPEPPFDSGTPERASGDIVEETRASFALLLEERSAIIKRITSGLDHAN